MLKTVEDISVTKKRLRIEIPAEVIEKEILNSLSEVMKSATLPGFRTGKAPISLIEKRYGKKIEGDVLEKMIPRAYVEAVKEAGLYPVSNPLFEEQTEFKRSLPLSMTLTLEVMPEIEGLNYEGLTVKEMPVSVEDTEIDDVLKRLADERATYEPSDGPVATDDLMVLDYSVSDVGEDTKDQVFRVGSELFPDELSKALVGRNKGDEFTADLTFPEGFRSEKLAGRNVVMKVLIKDIKKMNRPQIDDEFAKDIGFNDLDKLKTHIRETVLKSKESEVAKIKKAELLNKLIETYEFEIPESLLESELDVLASNAVMNRRKESNGKDGEAGEVDTEAIKQEVRPDAVRNVKASLLLEDIGRRENVAVTEDEMKTALIGMSRRFGVTPENLMKFYASRDGSLNGLRHSIFEDKVLDLILTKAKTEKGE